MRKSVLIAMCLLIAVQAYERTFKLNIFPPTDSWSAIQCAIDGLNNGIPRGVKFENQSGSCEPLLESLPSDIKMETKANYFTLMILENVFTPTFHLTTEIPSYFVMSSSMEFLVKTGGSTLYEKTTINIGTNANNHLCFHVDFRNMENKVVLNNRQNGVFNEEIIKYARPLSHPNTEYKVELMILQQGIWVYIDGDFFADFVHRVPFIGCNLIEYEGNVKLYRLKYHFPN